MLPLQSRCPSLLGRLIATIVLSATTVAAKDVHILFLGNSYTNRHNQPDLVERVLEEGDPTMDYKMSRVIYGGQNMFKHSTYYFSQTFIEQATISDAEIRARITQMQAFLKSESPPHPDEWAAHWTSLGLKPGQMKFADIHNHIRAAIKNHEALLTENPRQKWDYVVLQSWRDVSSDPDQAYTKYATQLARIARAQGAEVILYMTSPETQNQTPVRAPVAPESADRDVAIGLELVRRIQPKAVIPVPLALKTIQTGGTDLRFRYVNDGHLNQTCAFRTSNLFYAAMTGKSPEGFAYNAVTENKVKDGKDPDGGALTVVFDDETKRYLQRMAFEAVQTFQALAVPR
jgi:hypothetical protein